MNAQYGVPGRYIVALWGMESAFGQIQGKEDVISALSTLAFEGRREAFYQRTDGCVGNYSSREG